MFTETLILSTIIFVVSLFLAYLPSKITSTRFLKSIYPFITIAAAGFMLAMLLMDFVPHVAGKCSKHNHSYDHKSHTLENCSDPLTCPEHKDEILSERKKGHDHSHDHHKPHLPFFIDNFGFFVAGLAFILLLGIDSMLLQHSHCDNDDIVYMNDGINHGPHQHEYCHIHGDDEKSIEKEEVEKPKQEELEIEKSSRVVPSQGEKNQNAAQNHTKTHSHDHKHKDFHLEGSCNTSALKNKKGKLQAIIFIIALSIHSLFEGLAIKASSSGWLDIGIFEIGIIIHKALESFALGFTICMADFTQTYKIILMTVYSTLTPLGIFIGYFFRIIKFSKEAFKVKHIINASCNGLALGSILFIVCVEMIPPNFHSKGADFTKISVLTFSYLLTATLIYLSHK